MVKFVSGDMLQSSAQYLAQGVATGAQEGLGTGLAHKISSKWPEVQKQFKRQTRNKPFDGGDLVVIEPEGTRPGFIYIATQPDLYHATRSFLNKGLKNLASHCSKNGIVSVALPKIGAGLGKLDWNSEVKPLMVEHLTEGKTRFFIYEEFKIAYEKGEQIN
ncbi:MAG: macro domain-containing protein [Planctomycetes bacterium]|nr:macro domain-containing protein [Planctomycetota bacterium]